MIKNNIKLIIGFILGAIMFTSLGVCAATLINGKEVKYDNTNAKTIDITGVTTGIQILNISTTCYSPISYTRIILICSIYCS